MRIVKLDANECGGFRPPKGHLDTQMYPECKGWPTDRDIVKKTVEKRKKKKKKSSISDQSKEIKEAKHSWPIMREKEHNNEGIWEKWLNGKVDDKEFVTRMKQFVTMGFPGITKDPMVRDGIISTLRAFDSTGDYSDTARGLSGWLAAGKDIVEDEEHELNVASIGDEMTLAKKKKKEWDPNPWAVCTESVGREDKEKYERCIQKVKKKQAFNLSKFIKMADKYKVVDSEFNRKNYPDMIGKVLDSYAQVRVIKE